MANLKTDIVVIGTGAGGSAAALTAAEGGAKVIVFERRNVRGGISRMGMELFAVESKIQRQYNIPFTRDEAFRIFMERTHWHADARLARAFIDKTASTIDWLQNMGLEFGIRPYFVHPDSGMRTHLVKSSTGRIGPGTFATMMKILWNRAEEQGVEFHLSTPVKKIVKDGVRIVGVIAEDQSGEALQADTEAVIIASGGYPYNKEMLKKYGGFELGVDLFGVPAVQLTGDGIQMAWEVGAASDGVDLALMCGVPWTGGILTKTTMNLNALAEQPLLWINQHGVRFIDEGVFVIQYRANAVRRQKNRCAYSIFDGNTKKHLEEDGVDHVATITPGMPEKIADIDAMIQKAIDAGNENVFVADSLAELANKIGVNQDVLQKTVDEYNRFCEKGHDDLFAKNPRYLLPVKQPRFYSLRIRNTAYGTVGGIKINERAEVVNTEDEVIPGFYAAGDCANGAMAYDFALAHVLQGGPCSFALNTGRIAGENALEYIKTIKK
jgi:fumarate reductase flavoprotein subunit